MKRFISTFLMAALIGISVPMLAGTASAQRSYGYDYYEQDYDLDGPNVYDRHRKAVNVGVGAVLGALIGGKVGGKKGAIIGAAAGAAGGAIVTAKQRPRNYTRYPYYY